MCYIKFSTFLDTADCYTGNGFDYKGKVNRTRDGNPCQYWSKEKHANFFQYSDDGEYDDDGYEAFNYVYYENDNDGDDSTSGQHNYCRYYLFC